MLLYLLIIFIMTMMTIIMINNLRIGKLRLGDVGTLYQQCMANAVQCSAEENYVLETLVRSTSRVPDIYKAQGVWWSIW